MLVSLELAALEIRRILNQPRGEQQRKNSDRNIDEENPAPGEVVGDPAAESRTDRRRRDDRHSVDGECHAAFGGRKCIGQNRLLARLQSAAARALQNAADDQNGQIRRESAQERADREQGHAAHVEILAADDRRKPAAQRKNDGVRNKIGSENPGAFVLARGRLPAM